MKPLRIAFYGNFGAGNLGNESTLQTAIEHVLERYPTAQLQCFCTVPQDVERRHGIRAFRCTVTPSEWSPAAPPKAQPAPALGRRVRSTTAVKVFRLFFRRIPLELMHWVATFNMLKQSHMLIIPGTGIVTDHQTSPLGWPYELFKLCTIAVLCRVKVVFLSVGAGPITHPLSHWFVKRSLGFAHFRSYRDEASKRYMESIGFNTDRDLVYPDLVFGLSKKLLKGADEPTTRGRVIGLGLKDYTGPDKGSQAERYREYIDAMATIVARLRGCGYVVRLLIGDLQYDSQVREDVLEALAKRGLVGDRDLILAEPAPGVEELLHQLRRTDVVISPRFHNLVLGLMLGKPVIALSDLPKVDALMSDLGLAQYCMALEDLTPEGLIERFSQLQHDAQRLKCDIRDRVQRYREALDEQYDRVFAASSTRDGAVRRDAALP